MLIHQPTLSLIYNFIFSKIHSPGGILFVVAICLLQMAGCSPTRYQTVSFRLGTKPKYPAAAEYKTVYFDFSGDGAMTTRTEGVGIKGFSISMSQGSRFEDVKPALTWDIAPFTWTNAADLADLRLCMSLKRTNETSSELLTPYRIELKDCRKHTSIISIEGTYCAEIPRESPPPSAPLSKLGKFGAVLSSVTVTKNVSPIPEHRRQCIEDLVAKAEKCFNKQVFRHYSVFQERIPFEDPREVRLAEAYKLLLVPIAESNTETQRPFETYISSDFNEKSTQKALEIYQTIAFGSNERSDLKPEERTELSQVARSAAAICERLLKFYEKNVPEKK